MKKYVSIVLCIALAFSISACSRNKREKFSSSFLELFDTASTVIAYDESQSDFDEHMKLFKQRLGEYDKLYDIYSESDGIVNLCTLNKTAKNGPVKVDKKIIDLLEYCKYAYELSDGRVNVCFGSVLKLWHNAREYASANPSHAKLPDMERLKGAAQHTSMDDLVIDNENCTVYFADEALQLDVGAIAKGFAVKEISEYAKSFWSAFAISIGGNVSTYGLKDGSSEKWNIGIENPDVNAGEYVETLLITDLCVVSSGDYQRYFTVDEKNYCHIINPDTLMPSEYFSGVSVVCGDSALGDALSTALFNMPLDKGMALIESMENVEALWVDKNYQVTYSSNFKNYISNK